MIIEEYLQQLTSRIHQILPEKLNSLYIIGSASFEDYIEHTSDLDIFGVTNAALSTPEKDQLEQSLKHNNFPCPAQGLDLVLMDKEQLRNPQPEPAYEFWYATGAHWPVESWAEGSSSEMLIFMELCRRHGKKIFDQGPPILFSKVNRSLILQAFQAILQWHKRCVLDDYHDPNGQNSVLNACRILKYVETNQFYSKTEGGNLVLRDEPDNWTVQNALSIRQNKGFSTISKADALHFIETVAGKLDLALEIEPGGRPR